MKKLMSICLALVMVLTVFPMYAFAAENDDSEQVQTNWNYIAVSADEYDQLVFLLEHGTQEDREFAFDYIFNYANRSSNSFSWSPHYTQDMGDGTYLTNGFVYFYTYYQSMYVQTLAPASRRGSAQYGYSWTEVGSGYSLAGSGMYTYDGFVTTKLLNSQELYIAIAGNFEIAQENALSMGLTLDIFESSYSTSTTTYYRQYIEDYHVEQAPVRG